MRVLLFLLVATIYGCVNAYQQFYTPVADAYSGNLLVALEPLKEGEEPEILSSNNVLGDSLDLVMNHFFVVGYSDFSGANQGKRGLKDQAKSVGATLVLASAKYLDTQTSSYTTTKTVTSTTQLSGTANTSAAYHGVYSGYLGSSNLTNRYSGTATTSTQVPVINTIKVHRYNQTAVYFVKSGAKYKFGAQTAALDEHSKTMAERNTGAVVKYVLVDTPAFDANILSGDVIVMVNDQDVRDSAGFQQLLATVEHEYNVTIIRDKKERVIDIVCLREPFDEDRHSRHGCVRHLFSKTIFMKSAVNQ